MDLQSRDVDVLLDRGTRGGGPRTEASNPLVLWFVPQALHRRYGKVWLGDERSNVKSRKKIVRKQKSS